MDANNTIEIVPDLEEVSMEEAIEQHLEKPTPEMNSNPLLHAYSKQLQNENYAKLDLQSKQSNSDVNISQQSNMDEQTTDFFSSLNRLAGFHHNQSYNETTSSAASINTNEEDAIPFISSSSGTSASSSGIFSSSNKTSSALLTDGFTTRSSDLLIVGDDKNDAGNADDGCADIVEVDESEIETIKMTKETNKSLLIEVCQNSNLYFKNNT